MKSQLVNYLLDHVVCATPEMLVEVRSPAALKVHAIDLVKAIIAADPEQTGILQVILDSHSGWNDFKDQSHDLFITVSTFLELCMQTLLM
jgi:hypothetical protein